MAIGLVLSDPVWSQIPVVLLTAMILSAEEVARLEQSSATVRPGMHGKEATRRIRAKARFAGLPTIAVTAQATRRETEEILAAGVNSVVTKPVEHARLIEAVRSGLLKGASHA